MTMRLLNRTFALLWLLGACASTAGGRVEAQTPAQVQEDADDAENDGGSDEDDKPDSKQPPARGVRRTLDALMDEVRHPPRAAVFHPPPATHFAVLEQVAAELSQNAQRCDEATLTSARQRLSPVAMEIQRLRQKGTTYLVIREVAGGLRGNGVYVMRCGTAAPLAVEAPHSYFDLNTGPLAYKVFRQTKARWLLSNSVHRYSGRKLEVMTDDTHPADMAHNPTGLFQAVHQGVLAALPTVLFVQLHGFDSSWRDADVVLSDGRVEPQVWSAALAAEWTGHSLRTVVFGRQFQGLGAMTNVQAQAANSAGGRFLHIELDLELRRELVGSGKKLRGFSRALRAVAEKEP